MPSTHPIRIDASFTFKDTGELQQFLDKKHFGEPIPDPDYGEIKKFLPNKNSAIQGFSPEYWTIGSSAYIFQDKVPRVNGTIVNNRIELTLHTDKSHLENTLDRLALSLKCIARASFAGFEKNYRLQLPPRLEAEIRDRIEICDPKGSFGRLFEWANFTGGCRDRLARLDFWKHDCR